LGVGVDAERIERFRASGNAKNPLPLVISDREFERASVQPDPASALCASFCFKEALFKAVGAPFDPLEAEWLCSGSMPGRAALSPELMQTKGIGEVAVRVVFPEPGECVTIVHLFGTGT